MFTQGDLVNYRAREAWGIGIIEFIAPNGWATVSFEINGEPWADDFHPAELKAAQAAITRTA